jgi:hypothetical protein
MVDLSPNGTPRTWERAAARLDELAAIEAGWLDPGVGEPLSPVARSLTERLLEKLTALGTKVPYLFLTEDGGVNAEWHDRRRVSVEITPGEDLVVHALGRDASEDSTYVELSAAGLPGAALLAAALLLPFTAATADETSDERAIRAVTNTLLGYGLTAEQIAPHIDLAAGWLPYRSAMRGFRWLEGLGVHGTDAVLIVNAAQLMWADGPYEQPVEGSAAA